jgi:hypothetical protein
MLLPSLAAGGVVIFLQAVLFYMDLSSGMITSHGR